MPLMRILLPVIFISFTVRTMSEPPLKMPAKIGVLGVLGYLGLLGNIPGMAYMHSLYGLFGFYGFLGFECVSKRGQSIEKKNLLC